MTKPYGFEKSVALTLKQAAKERKYLSPYNRENDVYDIYNVQGRMFVVVLDSTLAAATVSGGSWVMSSATASVYYRVPNTGQKSSQDPSNTITATTLSAWLDSSSTQISKRVFNPTTSDAPAATPLLAVQDVNGDLYLVNATGGSTVEIHRGVTVSAIAKDTSGSVTRYTDGTDTTTATTDTVTNNSTYIAAGAKVTYVKLGSNFYIVECPEVCDVVLGQATLSGYLTTATSGVAIGSFSFLSASFGLSSPTTADNRFRHRGQTGDKVLLLWSSVAAAWIIIDVEKHAQKIVLDFRIKTGNTAIEANCVTCALEYGDNAPAWEDKITLVTKSLIKDMRIKSGNTQIEAQAVDALLLASGTEAWSDKIPLSSCT